MQRCRDRRASPWGAGRASAVSLSLPAIIYLDGKAIALDGAGFLRDPEQWRPELAEALAERDGIRLGSDHWWLIEFVRDYHAQYGTPPLMRVVVTELRRQLDPSAGSRELYRLFPDGPVRMACKYGGLPKPEWCI